MCREAIYSRQGKARASPAYVLGHGDFFETVVVDVEATDYGADFRFEPLGIPSPSFDADLIGIVDAKPPSQRSNG